MDEISPSLVYAFEAVVPKEGDQFLGAINRFLSDSEVFGERVRETLRTALEKLSSQKEQFVSYFSVQDANKYNSSLWDFLLKIAILANDRSEDDLARSKAKSAIATIKMHQGEILSATTLAHEAVEHALRHEDQYNVGSTAFEDICDTMFLFISGASQLGHHDKAISALEYPNNRILGEKEKPSGFRRRLYELKLRSLQARVYNEAGKIYLAHGFMFELRDLLNSDYSASVSELSLAASIMLDGCDILQSVGHSDEALTMGLAAIDVSRTITKNSKSIGAAYLALSYRRVGFRYGERGETELTRDCIEKSLVAARQSVEIDRNANLPVLAVCLSAASKITSNVGDRKLAMTYSHFSVDVGKSLISEKITQFGAISLKHL